MSPVLLRIRLAAIRVTCASYFSEFEKETMVPSQKDVWEIATKKDGEVPNHCGSVCSYKDRFFTVVQWVAKLIC